MPTENPPSNTEMVSAAPAPKRNRIYVEVRECEGCNHIGIDDAHSTLGACHECDWSGPEPVEDKCPGCGRENVIAAACPDCGSRYVLAASKEFEMPAPQYHTEPMAWMVGNAVWWDKASAERDSAEVGLPVIALGAIADPGEVERLHEEVEKQRRLKLHVAENLQNALDNCSVYRHQLTEQRVLLQLGLAMINRGIVSFDDQCEYRQKLAVLSANAEPKAQNSRITEGNDNGHTEP